MLVDGRTKGWSSSWPSRETDDVEGSRGSEKIVANSLDRLARIPV